ncbi:MAG: cbb3-type cytochrome oxidase assembly protein CcoS [Bacteroidia bacterium]|nr:cbb3-type cytochrome oxidase assembly protein CcoS [Bacteroidia bacterium]
MSVLIILIIASILLAAGFLIAFIWSVKNGQYDDDYTPSVRMLFDNTIIPNTKESNETISTKEKSTNNN